MAKTARKVAAKKPSSVPAAIKPVKQTLTKSALMNLLAEENEIPRKTAVGVYTTLENLFLGSVHPRGVGEFVLPGLLQGQPAQGSGPQSRHARPQSFNGGDGESRSQAGQRTGEDPGVVEAEDRGDSVVGNQRPIRMLRSAGDWGMRGVESPSCYLNNFFCGRSVASIRNAKSTSQSAASLTVSRTWIFGLDVAWRGPTQSSLSAA